MLPDEQIIWLAGLLEGEGSFSIHKNSPVIHLSMTDRDVVVKAATIMSCTHGIMLRNKHDNRKVAYQCSLWGLKAVIMMRKILPYMGQRRTEKITKLLVGYDSRKKVA